MITPGNKPDPEADTALDDLLDALGAALPALRERASYLRMLSDDDADNVMAAAMILLDSLHEARGLAHDC